MWSTHSGPSGEPPTQEQMRQMQQWARRMSPPDNEFPAGVALTAMLGRNDRAAVGISNVAAFSTGFRFTLSVRLRQAGWEFGPGGLHMLVGAHGHPGIEIPLENRLLLGIEYPNGERASNLQRVRMPGAEGREQELTLVQNGGGGGDRSVDHNYWVCPLPPEGPVTFIVSWPGFGIPESRTVIDSEPIRAAAGRSQLLWPPQPPAQPPQPPAPPRPSAGWFADPPD